MERRLGRGLGSLLSRREIPESTSEIEIRRIQPNPHQPRRAFDAASLEELKSSIGTHGVLQPVVVRRVGDGFELIAGERRWRAARLAGLQTVPAVVRDDVGEDDMLELALVENLQREDLDPIEKAHGFQALMGQLDLTQEQVAEKVGLKRPTVANHLRLLDLPQEVQDLISQRFLSMGHAKALLGLQDPATIVRLAGQVARKDVSVREVERLVQERTGRAPAPSTSKTLTPSQPPWATEMQRRMQDSLGTRVHLRAGRGMRGQIVIDFYNQKDLERLVDTLAPRASV